MISYRIKHGKIISELYISEKPNGKTIVFLPGLPGILGKNETTKYLISKGFTVFQPYYSGSFDSGGIFSPTQCIKDVRDFITMAKKASHKELYFGKTLTVLTKDLVLFGTSFGSSIACLASDNKDISKMVLFAPVLTYDKKRINSCGDDGSSFSSRMVSLLGLLKNGYKYTYRIKDFSAWRNFLLGKDSASDPILYLKDHFRGKALILQGEYDSTLSTNVTAKLLEQFAPDSYNFVIVKDAGHSLSDFKGEDTANIIYKFLNE